MEAGVEALPPAEDHKRCSTPETAETSEWTGENRKAFFNEDKHTKRHRMVHRSHKQDSTVNQALSNDGIIQALVDNKSTHDPQQSCIDEPVGVEFNTSDPTSYQEAISSSEASEWLKAMEEEIQSLRDHDVWKLEDVPKGTTPVSYDLLVLSENAGVRKKAKQLLNSHSDDGSITLTQETYVEQLLRRFSMSDAKGVPTPMELRPSFPENEELNAVKSDFLYREIIDALLYLAQRTIGYCLCGWKTSTILQQIQ
uniref:Reverse transcriptase Ty1/copia-type domain-containing protein n=1 Tax=Trichuris muris TaxID=70415 RepID=A0A5S6QWQ5_TRIMR